MFHLKSTILGALHLKQNYRKSPWHSGLRDGPLGFSGLRLNRYPGVQYITKRSFLFKIWITLPLLRDSHIERNNVRVQDVSVYFKIPTVLHSQIQKASFFLANSDVDKQNESDIYTHINLIDYQLHVLYLAYESIIYIKHVLY